MEQRSRGYVLLTLAAVCFLVGYALNAEGGGLTATLAVLGGYGLGLVGVGLLIASLFRRTD